MTQPSTPQRGGVLARVRDRAEEIVYRLNEANHPIFRAYDLANELFAAVRFRRVRRRAAAIDAPLRARNGTEARLRFLAAADTEPFVELLDRLAAVRYRPPHPLDRAAALRALRRRSYMPFGIFVGGRLAGYVLLRFFLPGRVVTGIWTLPDTHNVGLGQASLRVTTGFVRAEGLPDYCTVPIDNLNSLRVATSVGWRVIRTNRRFHVLLVPRAPNSTAAGADEDAPERWSASGAPRFARAAAIALWALAIVLRLHNAASYPLDGTADAKLGHLAYLTYVRTQWRQPPTTLNWETWQPPLYYWAMAGVWSLVAPLSDAPENLFAWPQRAVLPAVSSLLGLLTAWIAVRVVRRVVPGDPLAAVLALALVLFWPMHLMLAPWIRSDLLATLMAAAVLARLVAAGDLATMPLRSAAALGALAGLALLAKYTGVSSLAVIVASFGCAALGGRRRMLPALGRLGVVCAVAAALGGWFYADHWLAHGKAFVTAHDWLGGFSHPPGARSARDYLTFPLAVFAHPWVRDPDVIHSVWAGTYATAWFDGQYVFLNHYMSRATAEPLGRLLLALGLVPTAAIVIGGVRALARCVRDRRLLPYGPLLLGAAATIAAYVSLNLEGPYYSTVKAHYLLPAVVPLTVFFALSVAAAPRWLRAVIAANIVLLVAAASAVFWFDLIH
jgi:hypothetical protein